MHIISVLLFVIYLVVIEVIDIYFEEGTENKVAQWFLGIDELGHSHNQVPPMVYLTLVVVTIAIILWNI